MLLNTSLSKGSRQSPPLKSQMNLSNLHKQTAEMDSVFNTYIHKYILSKVICIRIPETPTTHSEIVIYKFIVKHAVIILKL